MRTLDDDIVLGKSFIKAVKRDLKTILYWFYLRVQMSIRPGTEFEEGGRGMAMSTKFITNYIGQGWLLFV